MGGIGEEVGRIQSQIQTQGEKQQELAENIEKNFLDPNNSDAMNELAQALLNAQQDDKLHEDIKKVSDEIEQNKTKMQAIKDEAEIVK